MLLGSGVLLVLTAEGQPVLRLFAAGLMAGLMHLTRADGIFWAAVVVAWAVWKGRGEADSRRERVLWASALAMVSLAGYLSVMIVWYGRNLSFWGMLFPPGGSRTLWLTRYEDMFIFPASILTPVRWLGEGWGAILAARWQALVSNFQTWVAVQGSIALFPFILVGLWRMRRHSLIRLGMGMWLVTLVMLTVVFPFAGINGSFFHSGAAFQPLFWAAAPLGIADVVDWLARLRKWERGPAVRRFLQVLLVTVCALLTMGIYTQRVIGNASEGIGWNGSADENKLVEARLVELGATPNLTVMVNNPPGYYASVGRSAVVIPFGDENSLLAAAKKYAVSYLLLDESNAWHLEKLYNQPHDSPEMQFLGSLGKTRIYAFRFQ
jgi:hypothetical protein